MASKPILFNTEMVRAILDGRKTMTRRLIKDKDITDRFDIDTDGKPIAYIDQATGDSYPPTIRARYQIGDILWVRETWLKADDGYYYKADIEVPSESEDLRKAYGYKWKPSIHMPREVARIFLRVTNVRVERVHEITEDEVFAEGLSPWDDRCADENWKPTFYDPDSGGSPQMIQGFSILWDELNKKRGYGWEQNPWVWVYEFERVNEDGNTELHDNS